MIRVGLYAPKGKRCYGVQDWGAKGRTNVIGALLGGALLTVNLFSTTINTQIFDAWVIQDLIPKRPGGSVVFIDNAAFLRGLKWSKPSKKQGTPSKPKHSSVTDSEQVP